MENPTDINSANRGWMRVGLLGVVWGRRGPRSLRCVKAELPILSILLLPFLLTKSHVLICPECKASLKDYALIKEDVGGGEIWPRLQLKIFL